MRILLEVSTLGFKTYHFLAKRINEIYPESQFGIIRGPKVALDFLQSQNDIKYQIFDTDCELTEKDVIDYHEIEKFENTLVHKSIWRIVASDRGLGRAFLHGAVGYEYDGPYDREYILRYCTKLIKRIKETFNEFKPEIFIPAIAMGDIGVTILDQICKENRVPYLLPDGLRIKNYFSFSFNHQNTFPQVDELTEKLINNEIEFDKTHAEQLYKDLLENLDFFDTMNPRHKKREFSGFLKRMNYRYIVISFNIIKSLFNWFVDNFNRLLRGDRSRVFSFIVLYRVIRNAVISRLQRLNLTHSKFGTILEPSQKYIYFPLTGQPEYSNNILGTMWMDHHHLIETLAKSIPHDWVVYVKEHSGLLSDRIRTTDFYTKIKKLPNVILAPIYTSSLDMISNAEMIAVISGTSAWEAILCDKPVIEFRKNLWSVIGLSRKCTDIEKLSITINDEINRINKITQQERKRRIICFLAAVLDRGFWMSNKYLLFSSKTRTDDEYEMCGRELVDGLLKHLHYLQTEKGYSFGIHKED